MTQYKVEVKRKSDNELVYGNEGDDRFLTQFQNDMAKYDDASHVKTTVDSTREFMNREMSHKRLGEYPTILEIIEALMENLEGDATKLNEALALRAAIKTKYPKV